MRNYIDSCQNDFINCRSTIINLTVFTEHLLRLLDSQRQDDIIYEERAQAFDRIDHGVVLNKLLQIGFSKDLIKFFNSFLSNRRHYVTFNFFSKRYKAILSIPQGSNLAPLLLSFSLMICLDGFLAINCCLHLTLKCSMMSNL